MHHRITMPPASRAAESPSPIDDALVADIRRSLQRTIAGLPPATDLSRSSSEALFAVPMTTLCADARAHGVPIEKLIVAIKIAWASLGESRVRLGDGASEALAGAVTAVIQAYFAAEARRRAD